MKTVYKFQLSPGRTTLNLTAEAKILHVAEQYNGVCLWAELDTDAPGFSRSFCPVPTGGEVPYDSKGFVGTVLMMNGSLVYHIYEV